MLRLLLGHWKAHRKKPSLLPEDGDVHFEEPSTINPLYEDSDSSISSNKVPTTVNSDAENHIISGEEQEQDESDVLVINELVDISVPINHTKTENSDTVPSQSEEINIERPKDSKTENQKHSEIKRQTDAEAENPKDSVTTKQVDSGKSETTAISENLKEDDPSVTSESINAISLKTLPNEEISDTVLSKDEEKSTHLETEEKMRIWNPPSTSAILKGGEKPVSNTQNGAESSHRITSRPNEVNKNKELTNKQEKILEKKSTTHETSNNRFTSVQTQNVKDSIPSTKPVQSNNQIEKSENLRTRAIDELIKKFQEPSAENNKAANKFINSGKKQLPHSSKDTGKSVNKISESQISGVPSPPPTDDKILNSNVKSEKKYLPTSSITNHKFTNKFSGSTKEDIPSPSPLKDKVLNESVKSEEKGLSASSVTNDKIASKVIKPEKKDLPVSSVVNDQSANKTKNTEKGNVSSPSREISKSINKINHSDEKNMPKSESVDMPIKTNAEREALSNIFKFPPPPPLEQLPNESSLHGKILGKVSKLNTPFSKSSKISSENSREPEQVTRSDSSLDRTRTASSSKSKEDKEKSESGNRDETIAENPSFKDSVLLSSNTSKNLESKKLSTESDNNETKKVNVSSTRPKTTVIEEVSHASKLEENVQSSSPQSKVSESNSTITTDSAKKNLSVSNRIIESEASVSNAKSSVNKKNDVHKSPDQNKKSSISKAYVKSNSVKENENVKSHSEDSGITRGDQISSETTQEASPSNPQEETNVLPNISKKSRKDKKLKSINKKHCKNCRRTHDDGTPLKRSQCDDYYDGLTGVRHSHRGRHSDSWTSDLSWEEKEFLRRLRSRRGTVRSNTPSTRSRLSKHRFVDESHFRRSHNLRRSFSDESTFYGSSVCSCDECWALFVKDYTYGRASLRGMPPIHVSQIQLIFMIFIFF